MNQQPLFDDETTAEMARPLFHRHDPVTSALAAIELVESGTLNAQCTTVLAALAAHPNTTSDELAHRAGLDRHMVARRLPDLSRAGLAKQVGRRPSDLSGRVSMVWCASSERGSPAR